MIWQPDKKSFRQIWAARTAGDVRRLPAKHFLEKGPGIVEGRFRPIVCDVGPNNGGVRLGLARWR